MRSRLNVLILHRLGDPRFWRQSVAEKELCLPQFAAGHNYVVHDFYLPLPRYVSEIAFDAIVLTQSFLGGRQDSGIAARREAVFGKLLRSPAYKIALPQDDYTCSGILDRWMCEWKVDVLYPVCVDHWDVLYPAYSKIGRLKQGFTGYLSGRLIERTTVRRPIAERTVDVAYRAASLSPVFGRMGQIKAEFGERFLWAAERLPLRIDVSTRPQDTILGTHWYDFIEDSRCMLGVNSGSSLLDPDGLLNVAVNRYLQRHPKATFEEVEAACFPGLEGKYNFTAISPRNLECALFGTTQILAPGPYGGYFRPNEHYIPLEPDMSNFREVVPLIRDDRFLQAMADRCREVILSHAELRYDYHVADLIAEIRSHTRVTEAERVRSVSLIERHGREMAALAPGYWRRERIVAEVRKILGNLGLRWLKQRVARSLAARGEIWRKA